LAIPFPDLIEENYVNQPRDFNQFNKQILIFHFVVLKCIPILGSITHLIAVLVPGIGNIFSYI